MSEQAKLYTILKNSDNERCIILTPQSPYKTEVSEPEILYACGEHAILYRNKEDVIILDYYPTSEQEYLKTTNKILIVEYDIASNCPTREYVAKISIVKKLPDITQNLITTNT